EIYDRDPERRGAVAMGLTLKPGRQNWPYLVRSLSIVEGPVAAEVLKQLAKVDRLPQNDPEAYRQTILRGLALGDQGGEHAVAVLEWWTGEQRGEEGDDT